MQKNKLDLRFLLNLSEQPLLNVSEGRARGTDSSCKSEESVLKTNNSQDNLKLCSLPLEAIQVVSSSEHLHF